MTFMKKEDSVVEIDIDNPDHQEFIISFCDERERLCQRLVKM